MIEESVERIERWRNGESVDPEKVQIYPTNLCNLDCIFCAQQLEEYGYESELSNERWFEVAEEISNMNVERVLISGGGEPFCRSDLVLGMMEIFKDSDIRGRLITNGTVFSERIVKRIVRMHWDTIVFSIDGPDAKIHDSLRNKSGTFGKIVENLKLFKEIREKGRPELEVNFVLNEKNFRHIPEMVSFCEKFGISSVNFEPLTVNNPRDRALKLDSDQMNELVEEVIPEARRTLGRVEGNVSTNLEDLVDLRAEKAGELKEEIFQKVDTESSENSFYSVPCYEPWLWPKIEPNGDVWPCSTTPLRCNVKENEFESIWYGKEFQDFRSRILDQNLPESCENCVVTHLKLNEKIRRKLREL